MNYTTYISAAEKLMTFGQKNKANSLIEHANKIEERKISELKFNILVGEVKEFKDAKFTEARVLREKEANTIMFIFKSGNDNTHRINTTINKDGSINFIYSNNIDGHFGIPKVIWSNGAGDPIIDEKGKYGLTQFAYAIVDDKQNLQKIKEAMINKKFINLMKYLVFKENHTYNYKIIALFKKDFYKSFLPKSGNKSVSLPKKHKSNKLHKRNKSI